MKLPPKTVILTFDDGPHHKNTSKILDVLREYQVKAIFFEVGRSVGSLKKPDLIRLKKRANISKKILADGHLLANHTMDHPALTKLGKDKIKTQLNNTSTLLNKVGQVDINLFRPPYGAINTNVQAVINEAGMKTMLWNIDSRDWADPIPSSISNRVLAQAKKHNGGIILFHDIHNRTVKSLRLVLETLKAKRYTFALHDGQRLLKPKVATSTSKGIKSRLYQKSHAVIIGINNYEKWPKLNYAVNDAVSMKELLIRSFRFEPQNVHLLLNENATRKNILSILGDGFADSKQVQADDRVLVFFAGHGTTRQLPSGRALGYIIPVDADLTSFQSQAISMTTFQDINEAITAKHIFYLMDACYGGQALLRGVGTGYDSSNYLSEITKRFTRQVLTAGGADEQVTDNGPGGHSIFTWSILEGLRGKADLNGDLHITATELFAYVGPIVSSLSHQTPAFGSLVGSEGGEFVFELGTEEEFLTDTSAQLDDEAIELNRQIAIAKNALAEKQTRNAKLKKELAAVQVQLANLGTATARGKNSTDALSKPSNAAKLRKLAMELFREKKYQESIDTYKQSHELEPTNALTTNNLGFSYFKIGELDTALKWYNKTLELAPERAVAFFNIGQLHEKNQDAPKAIEAYQRFLELAPEHKLTTRVKNKLASLEQAAN